MITPQELIDLPGYGKAVKDVKKMGLWKDTALETLYSIPHADCNKCVNDKIDQAISELENGGT